MADPRFGQNEENQGVTIAPMDFKKEIGRRIRDARKERDWILDELSQKTGDRISGKRINSYENGDRMPGPQEAIILGKALGLRPAYIMALDDPQIPITPIEESMVKLWRKLPERERMDFFRKIEQSAIGHADPASDVRVARALGKPGKVKT